MVDERREIELRNLIRPYLTVKEPDLEEITEEELDKGLDLSIQYSFNDRDFDSMVLDLVDYVKDTQ